MTATSIIEKLNNFEFHDLIVESIQFHCEPDIKVIVTALRFEAGEYLKVRLTFSHMTELKANQLIFDKDSELELSAFDYEFNDHFNCKMVFLLGFGKPSLTIEIKCGRIDLEEFTNDR
jgi:hypothetical protein